MLTCNNRRNAGISVFYVVRLKAISVELKPVVRRRSDSRVEAGSNTSTIPRRVIRGDKKGTQCLGV
jgi:hypothetical protein